MTRAVELAQVASTGVSEAFKNRIINGAMVIDQRNAGASITQNSTGSQYSLDRWLIYGVQASKFTAQQNAGSVTPPAGFTNYLGCTSTSAYSVLSGDNFQTQQMIEGLNVADLGWGTANAKTVTLSFWVRSSLTGTFGGALANSAFDRSYPYSYTISSANTWEYKTVTIAGDTSGTWLTTNGIGIRVIFSLGAGSSYSGTAGAWNSAVNTSATGATSVVGTNGATFYITGVQLEVGSTATSFDYRPYGTELALCQRYYQKSYAQATVPATATTVGSEVFVAAGTGGEASGSANLRVTMRATPTITVYSTATGASGNIRNGSTGTDIAVSSVQDTSDSKVGYIAASRTTGQIYSYQWIASIEL